MTIEITRIRRPAVLVVVVLLAAIMLNGLLYLTANAAPDAGLGLLAVRSDLGDRQFDSEPTILLVENQGQFEPQVRFMFRHGLGQTWLTDDAIWLSLLGDGVPADDWPDLREETAPGTVLPVANLRLSFQGGNPKPLIEPTDAREAKFTYLLGDDPAEWIRQAPAWGQVRYRDIYPGIDLVISTGQDAGSPLLPWRLDARDGADLSAVRLLVEGPAMLSLAGDGMRVETGAGEIGLPLLEVRNESGGLDVAEGTSLATSVEQTERVEFLISSPFASQQSNTRSVAVAEGGLSYSTYLGGSSWDWVYDVAIDGDGAAYVVGVTPSADFPTATGSFSTTLSSQDAFVVKLNPDGSDLEYGTFLGGSAADTGYDIKVVDGQAFVTGNTWSADFPTTAGAFDTSCGVNGLCDGWTDAFLARLSADGGSLLYATYLGGQNDDRGYAVDVSAGTAYVTGVTLSEDFPTTSGAFDRECGSDGHCDPVLGDPLSDAFLVRLDPAGGGAADLLYGTYLGGNDDDAASDLAVSGGDAFITGQSYSPDFPASDYTGDNDAFIVRVEPVGAGQDDLIYSVLLGGTGGDRGNGIAAQGSIASVTGETGSSDFPVITGTYNGGINDAFVARLNPDGGVTYAAFVGGDDRDYGRDITIDDAGAMVFAGYTQSLSDTFPITNDAFDRTHNGDRDVFVARILLESALPQHITYASYLGGAGDEDAYGIAVDEQGQAFVAGFTGSITDYPVTSGSFSTSFNGGSLDGFVTKLLVGAPPGLRLEKHVNGRDADEAPGPYYYVGRPITWTYIVTNTGAQELTNVSIGDDQLGHVCGPATLASNEALTCEMIGTAEAGQYVNAATASGQTAPGVDPVLDVDLSHYFGATPEISLAKRTNGQDADEAPGLYIRLGKAITWSYQLTNSGNVPLTGIVLTDSIEGPVGCSANSLAANATMTCIMTSTTISGQYANQGSVFAVPPGGLLPVRQQDNSHYYGVQTALSVKKLTNGQEIDQAPGPLILTGDQVTWTYVVTNGSNITLTNLTLLDDQVGQIECQDEVGAGQQLICEESGLAIRGQYSNSVVVSGTAGTIEITAASSSYYFGIEPDLIIEKLTNGVDADFGPGPLLPEGDPVTWTYVVTNTGNITLTALLLTDSEGVSVDCGGESVLGSGSSLSCSGSGVAIAGQYVNVGLATATPDFGPQIQVTDPSHYYGSSPDIAIVKRTNGAIAAASPGPYITVDDPVTWTYQVTNTGNIILSALEIVDSQLGPISCPSTTLAADEEMICHHSGVAAAGQYSNTVVVTGTPPVGSQVSATAASHYFGVEAGISLTKLLNGLLVQSAPGPYVEAGELVTWTYLISNTGNATLIQLSLFDDHLGEVICPQEEVEPGAGMSCEITESVQAGSYSNTATVIARQPAGEDVTDQATSYYFGVDAGIRIQKLTNGSDADDAPGPFIRVGHPVTWSYEITNSGNITLTNVVVTDSEGVSLTCEGSILQANQSMTCIAHGVAISGQHSNTGSVMAEPDFGVEVDDSDPSHYFGSSPGVATSKLTNGQRTEDSPGPYILVNDPVTWTYMVTNTGNVNLSQLAVDDDQIGVIVCPGDELGASESMNCEATGAATTGQHENTVTVTGQSPEGPPSVAEAVGYYFGAEPVISLAKYTSGEIVAGASPFIQQGEAVTWTYVVTNSGNVVLDSVVIWDDNGTAADTDDDFLVCTIGSLVPQSGSVSCAASSTAIAGSYRNVATVSGRPPGGLAEVTAEAASSYFGTAPSMAFQKLTNGHLSEVPPGPRLIVGQSVDWSYRITNTGNITLTAIVVDDDNGTPANTGDDVTVCEISDLGPGQIIQCNLSGQAIRGQYANTARVTGTPLFGDDLTASAISHYFGLLGAFLPLIIK